MKRVLVTGATGFIGRQTLPFLESGYEVHATHVSAASKDEDVIWHKADLLNPTDIEAVCADIQPTHLLHFAWYVNPKDYKISSENERWQIASLALLKAFIENGGRRAVLAGSAMEYDPDLTDDFIREDAATVEHNAYAAAKIRTHAETERLAQEREISLAWGRIFNLYGPYEARRRLVSEVIVSLLGDKAPNISTGGLVLDYSYVKDTAGAFAALLDSDITGTVNIATGNPISLKQVALSVAEVLGKTKLVQELNEEKPLEGPARVVADVTKLHTEVGWKPRYSLEKGLEETIDWWQQNL